MESCFSKANQLPTKGANTGKIATKGDTIIEWLKGTSYENRLSFVRGSRSIGFGMNQSSFFSETAYDRYTQAAPRAKMQVVRKVVERIA